MKYLKIIIPILIAFLFSCEPIDNSVNNNSLIFSNSLPITITPYNYEINGKIYHFQGDSAYYNNTVDTLNNTPFFKWEETSATFILLAIFNAPIETALGNIKNVDNIVWRWNTGMEFENIGEIAYSNGKNVINGELISEGGPNILSDGLYYLGIWGWGSDAKKPKYSSHPIKFYVKNM